MECNIVASTQHSNAAAFPFLFSCFSTTPHLARLLLLSLPLSLLLATCLYFLLFAFVVCRFLFSVSVFVFWVFKARPALRCAALPASSSSRWASFPLTAFHFISGCCSNCCCCCFCFSSNLVCLLPRLCPPSPAAGCLCAPAPLWLALSVCARKKTICAFNLNYKLYSSATKFNQIAGI